MSAITKIKQLHNSFTNKEKLIAQYILDNVETVLESSTQQIGQSSSTSSAAVIRFSKKLGYSGFSELKVDLARGSTDIDITIDTFLNPDDTMTSLIQKSKASTTKTIDTTYKLLSSQDLQKSLDLILKAETIYLFGVGASAVICSDFQHKLMRLGKRVIFNSDFHVQLLFVTAITKNDLAIIISYSGNTKEVLTAAKKAKEMDIPTIAITQYTINPLSSLADISLGIPCEEKSLRIGAISSRLSTLIVLDLLYYGLCKNDLNYTNDKLLLSKDLVNEINE